jgi:hypothetical protein
LNKYFTLLFAAILLASCAAQLIGTPQPTQTSPSSEEIKAAHALGTFLVLLNEKNYADAVSLYGGDYEQLQVFNPDVNANDHATLWQGACEMSGLQCLPLRHAKLTHQEGDTYVFQVEFNNPDGSLFVLGPCCGADETEMPPVSQFEYTVMKNAEGKFVVMNLPPYVP